MPTPPDTACFRAITVCPQGDGIIVVDWGSNNLRAEYLTEEHTSAPVLHETVLKSTLELQHDISAKGKISKRKRRELQAFFSHVFLWAQEHLVREVVIAGTSAIREDRRQKKTLKAVAKAIHRIIRHGEESLSKKQILDRLLVIDGNTEADLAVLAVTWSVLDPEYADLLQHEDAHFTNTTLNGVVCDLGGGSVELALVREGHVLDRCTLPHGVLRLQERYGSRLDKAKKRLHKDFLAVAERFARFHGFAGEASLYCTGGGFRNLFRMFGVHCGDPFTHAHNFCVPAADPLRQFLEDAPAFSDTELAALACRPARAAHLPHVALVLQNLLDAFAPAHAICCSHSIRKGILHAIHQQGAAAPEAFEDPLVLQCQRLMFVQEQEPSLQTINTLLDHTFYAEPPYRHRLKRAFCMLADLEFDQLPALRAEAAFAHIMELHKKQHDLFAPLDPDARLFLALALAFRHQEHLPALARDFLSRLKEARVRMGYTGVDTHLDALAEEARVLGTLRRTGVTPGPRLVSTHHP